MLPEYIEKLAVFSNEIHLSKKAEANKRIKKILEKAMKSKDGNKPMPIQHLFD